MNYFVIIIIVLALGMIVGNILLLKQSAKFSMKNIKQDPIEKAKEILEQRNEDKSNK